MRSISFGFLFALVAILAATPVKASATQYSPSQNAAHAACLTTAGGYIGNGFTMPFCRGPDSGYLCPGDSTNLLRCNRLYPCIENPSNGQVACGLADPPHYYPQPTQAVPEKNVGAPNCPDQCFGDPIVAGTGAKFESRTEFQGGGQFPLEFGWTYSSFSHKLSGQQGSTLGRYRTHTLSVGIELVTTGSYVEAKVRRADGKLLVFVYAANAWHADIRHVEKLAMSGTLASPSGWIFTDDRGDRELFDGSGKIMRFERQDGMYKDVSYDAQGRPDALTDARGRRLGLSYNSHGLLSELLPPGGGSIAFDYSPAGDLVSVTNLDGTVRQYLYDEPGRVGQGAPAGLLTGIVDESQQRFSTTTYDGGGLATGVYMGVGADAYSATYYPSADGTYVARAVIATPTGRTREVRSSVMNGRVRSDWVNETCPGCTTRNTTYYYDPAGRQDYVAKSGQWTDRDYSALGLLTKEVEGLYTASKRTIETDWDASLRKPTERRVKDSGNVLIAKTVWTLNGRGQQLTSSILDPQTSATRTLTNQYCEQADVSAGVCPLVGLLLSADGARSDVVDRTEMTYRMVDHGSCATTGGACPYRKGDFWKATTPLGQSSEVIAYDLAGRTASVQDQNGVRTDFEYDPSGRLTAAKVRGANASSESDDAITRTTYWPTGLVMKIESPDGVETSFEYDAAHRLTAIADSAGNRIEYTLDGAGNRIAENTKGSGGALKRTLSRVYNALGQLATQADAQANPTDFTYDAVGNAKTVTDALGHVTSNDYDPLDRLIRTLQDVGGIEAETKFEYDANDNLTKVTDPKGLDTTYTYNGFGDQVQLSSPDTGITTFTYDSAGNRASQTDARGITTTYQYDALNRLTQVGYPTSSLNVSYTYDVTQPVCQAGETFSVGRLTLMVDGSGSTQYCHDRFGQLVRKVQTTNGVPLTLQYAYTKGGQLQAMTYPDGTVVDYLRNAQGQITEVGVAQPSQAREVLLTQATYHPFGPIAGWVYGNGRVMQRNVDLDYRPTSIQGGPGGLDLTYGYDAVGNLTSLSSGSPPPLEYGYDALGRLTESRDGPTQAIIDQYTYDKTGNRTSFTDSLGTKAYAYPSTSHRLSSVAGENRTYDLIGNTTSIGMAQEFEYNDAGRMNKVRNVGLIAMEYAYNGQGEQVRQHLGNTESLALYDEGGHWLGSYGSTGMVSQQVIWMSGVPVGVLEGSGVYYIQADHLGTPRNVIDSTTDTAIWEWQSKGEVFGSTAAQQDPDGNGVPFVLNLRMPGQRLDDVLGFAHNGFRQYDPSTGRFIQSDLLGLADGPSTYSYGQSSPLNNSDPSGLAVATMPWGAASPSINWTAVRLVASRLGPLAFAGSAGYMVGTEVSNGYEQVFGDSIGGDIFDLFDKPSMMADPSSIVEGLNGRTDGKITVPWPPKTPGLWTCICRAQSLNRLDGCEASTGYGLGMDVTISGARKKAEAMARLAVKNGVDFHHSQCKCTGPKGEQVNY